MPTDAPPRRIQRKRTRGWRMPEGAVYVGRPSRWGNPHWRGMTRTTAVALYRMGITPRKAEQIKAELRGKTLCCWCPLDQPCHADVLLEIANAE